MVNVKRMAIGRITAQDHGATPRAGRAQIIRRRTTLYLESALWNLPRAIARE